MKLKKSLFFQKKVAFLRQLIHPGCFTVSQQGKEAGPLRESLFQGTAVQLKRFPGACNVYRRLVDKYSHIARHRNAMLGNDASFDWMEPMEEHFDPFQEFMARQAAAPMFALPKIGRPYMGHCVANSYAVRAVLVQQQDEENLKEWATV